MLASPFSKANKDKTLRKEPREPPEKVDWSSFCNPFGECFPAS